MWREGGQDAWEGGHTSQRRETRRGTGGDRRRQNPRQKERPSGRRTHHPTKGNKKGYNGRHTIPKGKQTGVQWEAPLGRRPTKGNKKGYNRRQGETRPSARRTHLPTRGVKKGYNGRHRETRPSERQTHHPTKGNKKGYNGQWETKGNKKEGDNIGDKTLGKAGTPFNTKAAIVRKHKEPLTVHRLATKKGEKARQGESTCPLGKADTPANNKKR